MHFFARKKSPCNPIKAEKQVALVGSTLNTKRSRQAVDMGED